MTKDDKTVSDDGVEQLRERILHSLIARAVVGWKRVVLDSWTKNKEDGRRDLEACLALMTGGAFRQGMSCRRTCWTTAEQRAFRARSIPCTLCSIDQDTMNAL